jgi:hypothetical protein
MKQKCFDVIRRFRDPYVSDSVVWRQTSNFMSKIQLYTTIEVTMYLFIENYVVLFIYLSD